MSPNQNNKLKEIKKIFVVEHGCGWGSYHAAFFESYEGAVKFFYQFLRETKKKEEYIRRSMGKPKEEHDKVIYPKRRLIVYWKIACESNNENGHEYWDEDQYLEILEEEIKP